MSADTVPFDDESRVVAYSDRTGEDAVDLVLHPERFVAPADTDASSVLAVLSKVAADLPCDPASGRPYGAGGIGLCRSDRIVVGSQSALLRYIARTTPLPADVLGAVDLLENMMTSELHADTQRELLVARSGAWSPPPVPTMTVEEAADAIGKTPRRVRQLIGDGTLPARRDGRGYVLDVEAVESFRVSARASA